MYKRLYATASIFAFVSCVVTLRGRVSISLDIVK